MLVRGMFLVVAMVVSLVLAPFCWATSLVPMIQFGAEADYWATISTTTVSIRINMLRTTTGDTVWGVTSPL